MDAEELTPGIDEKLLFDNKKLLIDAMLAEKRDLRCELIGFERTQIQVIALFSLGVAAFMKILLDNDINKTFVVTNRDMILIAISQFSYVLCLVVNSVLSWINVHYSYIRAVEKKINKELGQNVSIWESVMVEKHINHIPSSFTFGFAVMGFSLVGTFVYMVYKIGSAPFRGYFYWVAGCEVLVYLIVFFMNLRNADKSYNTACAAFGVN